MDNVRLLDGYRYFYTVQSPDTEHRTRDDMVLFILASTLEGIPWDKVEKSDPLPITEDGERLDRGSANAEDIAGLLGWVNSI